MTRIQKLERCISHVCEAIDCISFTQFPNEYGLLSTVRDDLDKLIEREKIKRVSKDADDETVGPHEFRKGYTVFCAVCGRTEKSGIHREDKTGEWIHMGQLKPSTKRPHEAQPYARIGDNRCKICGDYIKRKELK